MSGYILDFYCVRQKLAVELDGGQHGDSDNAEYDSLRTQKLNELGIHVLRISDRDVLKDAEIVAEEIFRRLEDKKPSPQPSPGVPGEGGRCLRPPWFAAIILKCPSLAC